ncbi:MAG: hypothetical protein COA84_14065 [Robiginitomaculum sp.]|nr:MAG: hypothetical protein COA84_14065 [Robiginitomaculum sp.]
MAGIGRGTRGINTKLLYSLTAGVIVPATFTLAVGDVVSMGDLADAANTTEVTVYGEGYVNTFTTTKNIGQLDFEFLANTTDAGQTALEELYANGDTASFDLRYTDGTGTSDYMFDGQVSAFGVTAAADDIVRYTVSIVVHGAATKVDAT